VLTDLIMQAIYTVLFYNMNEYSAYTS
jgi:hypothetical protein